MKTRKELLDKYPERSLAINEAYDKYESASCKPCDKSHSMRDMLISIGEMQSVFTRENAPEGMRAVIDYNINKAQADESRLSPRPACEDCFKEHIAKAIININESQIGDAYPKHRWLAIGNLAEASAEILGLNKELAGEIREVKKQMMADKNFIPDLMRYL